MNIPQALKELRTSHGLKVVELAQKLGMAKSHISELESGAKNPTLNVLKAYAVQFKINASEILLLAEFLDNSKALDDYLCPKIKAMMLLKKATAN